MTGLITTLVPTAFTMSYYKTVLMGFRVWCQSVALIMLPGAVLPPDRPNLRSAWLHLPELHFVDPKHLHVVLVVWCGFASMVGVTRWILDHYETGTPSLTI